MHNIEKWPNIIKKPCVTSSCKIFKVWTFFNIMHETAETNISMLTSVYMMVLGGSKEIASVGFTEL